MRARALGSTGVGVSAIGLGGVPLSVVRKRPPELRAIEVILHAIDCGITLIDTADSYCLDDSEAGHNERLIGKALSQLPPVTRDRILVATKGGWVRPNGAWIPCGRPEHLRTRCESSLRNLRTDCIDLYQHHVPDPGVPLEESLGALVRLREEGKIRFLGVSNYSVAQLDVASSMTDLASVQNQYSIAHREPERDGVLEETRRRGLAFLPWSPLGGPAGARSLAERHPALRSIAGARGTSVYQIALAWLLSRGPHVLPIPGASRKSTIEDSAAAAELDLTTEEIAQLR